MQKGPLSVDVLDRIKYQGPSVVDQMSLWTLQTGPNVLQGFTELNLYVILFLIVSTIENHSLQNFF